MRLATALFLAAVPGFSAAAAALPGSAAAVSGDRLSVDENGFAVAPWENPVCPGLEQRCNAGDGAACTEYESTCQVN